MGKTAIILGATGLTGNILLHKLLSDDRYDRVKVFTRRSVAFSDPKLEEFVGDLLNLEQFRTDFTADEVYCCIGTTAKQTPDRDKYREIDFGIPVKAALLGKENGVSTFLVISAMGAKATSNIFYNRTKGEMEQAVLSAAISQTYILRPSLIVGDRDQPRFVEWFASGIMQLIQPLMVGSLKKYRSINAQIIAQAMIQLANTLPSNYIIESDKIEELGA